MANKTYKMICETAPEIELIKTPSSGDHPNTMKFRGCWLVSQSRNGNGRIYPYSILKPEVDRLKKEMLETDRLLMELEHPESCEINPMRAAARVLSLEEDNKTWVGEAVILCSDDKFGIKGTPCGDVLASLANYGTKFGVSSRALGDVDDDGIVTDVQLVTVDVVLNPSIGTMVTSDGNRLVNGILESKSWVCNHHGQICEMNYGKFENDLSRMPNTYIQSKKNEKVFSAIKDFFKSFGM